MSLLFKHRHHFRSHGHRGLIAFILVTVVVMIGTLGMHFLEKMSFLDAFYFMSMIASAQGPTIVPATVLGKIFASFMAFISVGVVVASLAIFFGPFMAQIGKIGVEHLEEEISSNKKQSQKK